MLTYENGEVEVRFDDGVEQSFKYPAGDVEIIQPDESGTKYYAWFGTPDQRLAYDADPAKLHVGDQVQCHYERRPNGKRFRGRVAGVYDSGKRVDILYDDLSVGYCRVLFDLFVSFENSYNSHSHCT